MKITSIEKQKKEGRYNIYLDGEFAFGAYRETVFNFGLRVNDELDEGRVREIREYDEIGYGKKTAYRFLNYKPRSESEIRKKLKEKKLSPSSIEKVIASLKDLNFLNDEQYAGMYLEEKLRNKPQGKRMISMKLAEKGISKNIIEKTIGEKYSEETETKKALIVLNKYKKKVKAKTQAEKKQKCFRYLLSKGFEYDIISSVMKIENGD